MWIQSLKLVEIELILVCFWLIFTKIDDIYEEDNLVMLLCNFQLIEQSEVIEAPGLSFRNISAVATTAIGEMVMSINI